MVSDSFKSTRREALPSYEATSLNIGHDVSTTRMTQVSPVYVHRTYVVNPLLIWGIRGAVTPETARFGGAWHTLPYMVPLRGTVGVASRDMELSVLSNKSVTPTSKARADLRANAIATNCGKANMRGSKCLFGYLTQIRLVSHCPHLLLKSSKSFTHNSNKSQAQSEHSRDGYDRSWKDVRAEPPGPED